MTLIVDSKAEPQLAVVEAIGEVDLASVPRLREEISEHIVAGRTNLLVDLQAVTYLDSTGLGVLVGASKAVQAAGGSLRLVCDNPRLLRLLRITGLDKAFAVHPTVEAALANRP